MDTEQRYRLAREAYFAGQGTQTYQTWEKFENKEAWGEVVEEIAAMPPNHPNFAPVEWKDMKVFYPGWAAVRRFLRPCPEQTELF